MDLKQTKQKAARPPLIPGRTFAEPIKEKPVQTIKNETSTSSFMLTFYKPSDTKKPTTPFPGVEREHIADKYRLREDFLDYTSEFQIMPKSSFTNPASAMGVSLHNSPGRQNSQTPTIGKENQ